MAHHLRRKQMRPYELPQQKYGLWHDVRERLGVPAGNVVATALGDGTHRVETSSLIPGAAEIIRQMAEDRNVFLTFS